MNFLQEDTAKKPHASVYQRRITTVAREMISQAIVRRERFVSGFVLNVLLYILIDGWTVPRTMITV